MPKKCKKPYCNYNQFGGGYCQNHQYLRTDKKPKFLKRTTIKKVSPKRKASRKEDVEQLHKDWLFYLEIWNERPHIDYETGEPIPGDASTLYFHHVLPKGTDRFKKYRYKKWNIVLVSWQTHSQAENDIDFVPKIKAYREQLLKQIKNDKL